MKCDDCFNLLEEYIDGEAAERDAAQISAHLMTCAACAHEFEALTAEREVYARYDRELNVSPATWNAIAARIADRQPIDAGSRFSFRGWLAGLFAAPRYAFAGAAAVVILALMIGVVYLRTRKGEPRQPKEFVAANTEAKAPANGAVIKTPAPVGPIKVTGQPNTTQERKPAGNGARQPRGSDQTGVLFTEAAYTDIEDKETAHHVAQAENLLRSVRSLKVSDNDEEIDVSYEKAESRRLLNENVVLRRDAEMAGKFPAKKLLGELEPFLLDIANLPDKTTSTDLRAINNRVQKTEIVAALRSY